MEAGLEDMEALLKFLEGMDDDCPFFGWRSVRIYRDRSDVVTGGTSSRFLKQGPE